MLQQMRNFHFIFKCLFITLQDVYMKSVHSVVHCNSIKCFFLSSVFVVQFATRALHSYTITDQIINSEITQLVLC